MKKQTLSKKDISKLNEELNASFSLDNFFSKKDRVLLVDDEIVYRDGNPCFFYLEEKLLPTLQLLQTNNFMKKVTVDMGAVKFVVKGADIMRPGITEFEEGLKKDDFIVIVDENNKKPLAIGQMMFDDADKMDKGKVIKNIHWVGDEIWKASLH